MSSVLLFIFDVPLIVYHPTATLTTLHCTIMNVRSSDSMSKHLSPVSKHTHVAEKFVQRTTIVPYVLISDDARGGRVNCFTLARASRCGAMSTEGLTDGNSILRCKVTLSVTRPCDAHATSHNLHDKKGTANERSICWYIQPFG